MEDKPSLPDESPVYYCSVCNAEVSFDDKICPRCGVDISELEKEKLADSSGVAKLELNPMNCPRCETALDYVGTKKFH